MIPQPSEFNLINGTFTVEEAKEILSNLFSDKIRFHKNKDFGHTERYGVPDPHAEKRIPELRKTQEEVHSYIRLCDSVAKVKIYADIKIELIK